MVSDYRVLFLCLCSMSVSLILHKISSFTRGLSVMCPLSVLLTVFNLICLLDVRIRSTIGSKSQKKIKNCWLLCSYSDSGYLYLLAYPRVRHLISSGTFKVLPIYTIPLLLNSFSVWFYSVRTE